MGDNTSQFVDELAWEGVVGLGTAVAIAIVLALLAAWTLWRERDAVGRRWAAVFWCLRLVAFGCALWMLAGPTWLHIQRSSTNQTIAIFADNSESMDVVDPVDPGDSIRWALAVGEGTTDAPLARCDRMVVALGAAHSGCQRLANYLAEHRSAEQMRGLVGSIGAAVARASGHAEAVLTALDGVDAAMSDRASRMVTLVDGPVAESLSAIRSTLNEQKRVADEDITARLEALLENLASARRRATVLSSDLAQQQHRAVPGRAEVDQLTRREKEGRALDAFEKEVDDNLTDDVRVERFQFAAAPVPVLAGAGWTRSLESASSTHNAAGRSGANTREAVRDQSDAAGDQQSTGTATNLSAVLEQLAKERTGASTRMAVIWSDGRHNDAGAAPPQEIAASLVGLPLFIVPIGNSAPLRDVVLHRVEAPTVVAEKDTAVIDVIVTGFECDGDATDIVLRRAGAEIERKPIEFTGEHSDARARFTVPSGEVGRQEYVVEVQPLDDEANTANNYMPVAFDVVRDQVRILLADSVRRWEHHYLSQLFRRDTHVQCDELLYFPRPTGTGRLAQRPELPQDLAGWANYDVVILGDLDTKQLTEASQKSLEEFVRTRGGNLIVIAGRDAMPGKFASAALMGMLPVEFSGQTDPPQGYGLRLTDEGRFHSALMIDDSEVESRAAWQRIYTRQPVQWLSEYCKPKSTARTLIEATAGLAVGLGDEPQEGEKLPAFMCWQRIGAGRVVYLAAPDTYRLRFLEGDRMHHRFWGQLLRWITASGAGAGTDLVRLQTDRMRYSSGEPVEVTVWLKDKTGAPLAGQTIQAEARTFEDTAEEVELTADADVAGRYFGTFDQLAAGAYNVTVKGDVIDQLLESAPDTELVKATISVRATDNVEMLNTQCNRALLEQLAQMTGGQVIPPTAIGEVLQLNSFTPEVVERTHSTPLWNRWSNMLIVLGCLFTEWIVRKAKGLV
ncbi:MAG: carboxypeptidase-like regulatory domain-containing protein [Pirellulales bacterium]